MTYFGGLDATSGREDVIAAQSGGPRASGPTAEGVDANASKKHLLGLARRLDVRGRSTMSKPELVDAIVKHNRRVRGR